MLAREAPPTATSSEMKSRSPQEREIVPVRSVARDRDAPHGNDFSTPERRRKDDDALRPAPCTTTSSSQLPVSSGPDARGPGAPASDGSRTAILIPINSPKEIYAREFLKSFHKFFLPPNGSWTNNPYQTDVYFVFTSKAERERSSLRDTLTESLSPAFQTASPIFGLPTLQEMADADGAEKSGWPFSVLEAAKFSAVGGGKSGRGEKSFPGQMPDVKQLYGIRELCERGARAGGGAGGAAGGAGGAAAAGAAGGAGGVAGAGAAAAGAGDAVGAGGAAAAEETAAGAGDAVGAGGAAAAEETAAGASRPSPGPQTSDTKNSVQLFDTVRYKYVVHFDADTKVVRAPTHRPFSFFLDEIYEKKEFFAGNAAGCHDDWVTDRGVWMKDLSENCPPRVAADWSGERMGYIWWNQLPFLKCSDSGEFFEDIGFPPPAPSPPPANDPAPPGRNGLTFRYLHMIHLSWLWFRRGWVGRRPSKANDPARLGVCGKLFCNLEYLKHSCTEFPGEVLREMGSLWVSQEVWWLLDSDSNALQQPGRENSLQGKHKQDDRLAQTNVFFVFHTDRQLPDLFQSPRVRDVCPGKDDSESAALSSAPSIPAGVC